MLAEERRARLLRLLNSKGSITVAELSTVLNVTSETIRRDLDTLSERNLLKRIHGGAVALKNRQEVPFDIRRQTNVEEKTQIARKAVRLVESGDTLFLDISSTAMFLARELTNLEGITVITNSVIISLEFVGKKDITVISTGGILKPDSYSLVGPLANEAVRSYRADKFFSSCRGFSVQHGVSDSNTLENEVKRTMMQQSSKLFLLMDHTKLDEIGLAQFASIEDIDTIVCDDGIDAQKLQNLLDLGVKVI